ncbi:MAG: 16S rRNA (cytosine(1402)-N(4))-methyltransferase RsmH [Bacteroidia bacterium]|nr:16S rRNA (cytosine(1402)-N(4))-methyltransferase RsmH [Bacteroidia bacterium]
MYHIPVLLNESVDGLNIKPDGIYADVTMGGAGHTRSILSRLGENGRLYAFDRDPQAYKNAPDDDRFVLLPVDFQFIEKALEQYGVAQLDGILADLGVSSHQFDTPERGFSFRFNATLDMRMDPGLALSAADVLNTYSAAELQKMFSEYGEVPNAKRLSVMITEKRKADKIVTTFGFEQAISDCIPFKDRSKYLAQVYQALRIEVNRELDSLFALLGSAVRLLKKEGRISIISYHSLEDRMVKHFFRSGNMEDKLEKDFYGNILTPWKLITKKAIQPSETEIIANPRARSARLRVAEKK